MEQLSTERFRIDCLILNMLATAEIVCGTIYECLVKIAGAETCLDLLCFFLAFHPLFFKLPSTLFF